MNNLDFCCDRMMDSANNAEIPIVFTPKFREFGIRVLDGGTSTVQLLFCPWCAQLLPSSLRDEWFDELERLGTDGKECCGGPVSLVQGFFSPEYM